MNIRITKDLRQTLISSPPRLFTARRSARRNPHLARLQGIPLNSNDFTTMAETIPTSADVDVSKKEHLPKLSASDFRAYNSMAEHMEYFHNRFRASWTLLYGACESGKRPSNISMRQFLSVGLDFCSHLELHHNIEEQHIFPVLAKKMPAFRHNLQMRSQHKEIHAGLVKLQEYLAEVRIGEKELNLKDLKLVMDGFGKVLWEHLNDEVEQLGAENMRTFWSVDEMRRMPM